MHRSDRLTELVAEPHRLVGRRTPTRRGTPAVESLAGNGLEDQIREAVIRLPVVADVHRPRAERVGDPCLVEEGRCVLPTARNLDPGLGPVPVFCLVHDGNAGLADDTPEPKALVDQEAVSHGREC